MPTLTAIGATLSVDDANGDLQNITNDVLSMTIATPRGQQDVTSLADGAMRRLLLKGDATINLTGVVNDSTNASFDVLVSTAGTYDGNRTTTYVRNGHTLTMEMVLGNVSQNIGQDGAWTFTADLQLANGSDPTWS